MFVSRRSFYDRICTVAGNALAFDLINRLVLRTSSLRGRSLSRRERQQQSPAEIDAIVRAIRKRDAVAAKKAAIAHVESAAASAFDTSHPGEEMKPAVKPRKPVTKSKKARLRPA
jgi:DNA-binding GntR family transcriptional regulator